MKNKSYVARMGPVPIEPYPVSAWTRWPEGVKSENVWKLCGPCVEKHIDRLPLWQVFCAVWFEAFALGMEAERAKRDG